MTLHINCFMGDNNLLLSSEKSIIQSGDSTNLKALVLDENGNPVEGATVNFYQQWTPKMTVSASKDIIQSGESVTLSAKLVDEVDGSIAPTGQTIYFYVED